MLSGLFAMNILFRSSILLESPFTDSDGPACDAGLR
jgi:hypothetical protein